MYVCTYKREEMKKKVCPGVGCHVRGWRLSRQTHKETLSSQIFDGNSLVYTSPFLYPSASLCHFLSFCLALGLLSLKDTLALTKKEEITPSLGSWHVRKTGDVPRLVLCLEDGRWERNTSRSEGLRDRLRKKKDRERERQMTDYFFYICLKDPLSSFAATMLLCR